LGDSNGRNSPIDVLPGRNWVCTGR
jgi:hypothetical protein